MYLCIVAQGDIPIYEIELGNDFSRKDMNQFIAHAALDLIEDKMWHTNFMYLKEVDQFKDTCVSAFITAGHTKFLLLHDKKTEESSIKSFFLELHEMYIKAILNPFYEFQTQITLPSFSKRVQTLGNRHLVK